jgi:hypothetical protein
MDSMDEVDGMDEMDRAGEDIRPLQGRKKEEDGFWAIVHPGVHPGLPAFVTTYVVTNALTPSGSQ